MTAPHTATRFALLRELFRLARAQRQALEAEGLERFEELLEAREHLIGELQSLAADAAAAPLPENIIPFPGAVSTEADDALALDTLIRGILEHDHHNEQLLATMLDGIRAELPALDHGRRTAARYAVTEQRHGFIDHRS